MDKPFADCRAIVTGGTRGIGRAVSEMLLRGGAGVTAVYGGNDEAAAAFARDWADYPLKTVKLDVADYNACEAFFTEFDGDCDHLEILVNAAGIRRDAVVGMMSVEDWRRVIDINLSGSFNMTKFAVQRMMQNRYGRIVCVTSPSGRLGFAGQANYAASKAGQVALMSSLAKEVGRRGITANCVSPGFIETDLIADLSDEQKSDYRKQVPLKRFGRPEEVADAVRYLVSREAAYVTGTVVEISGGL
jgi:3-oxoacyl-[acyl-carrier protein] reductase